MKRGICLFALSSVMLAAVGCGNNQGGSKEVDVVLISGQSNAVGISDVSALAMTVGIEKYHEFLDGYPSIQIAFDSWTKDADDWNKPNPVFRYYSQNSSKNKLVKVKLGMGNSVEAFGPEIGIADLTHETRANKLFLIKYACGASNLKDDWTKRDSPMYGRFIDYVKLQMGNIAKKGYKPTIKAFCWMQGEGDAYNGYYQVYLDNLREFVANVRTDLKELSGNKDMAFIDAGISSAPKWQYYRQVNEAKEAFAAESENNIYIDTIAAGLHTDKESRIDPELVHYDSDSQVELGHLFAEAFEPFLTPLKK